MTDSTLSLNQFGTGRCSTCQSSEVDLVELKCGHLVSICRLCSNSQDQLQNIECSGCMVSTFSARSTNTSGNCTACKNSPNWLVVNTLTLVNTRESDYSKCPDCGGTAENASTSLVLTSPRDIHQQAVSLVQDFLLKLSIKEVHLQRSRHTELAVLLAEKTTIMHTYERRASDMFGYIHTGHLFENQNMLDHFERKEKEVREKFGKLMSETGMVKTNLRNVLQLSKEELVDAVRTNGPHMQLYLETLDEYICKFLTEI